MRYNGDIDLLQYIPRSGSSSSLYQEIFVEDDEFLHFEVKSVDKDINRMRDKKENTIKFLKDRSESIATELEEYNIALPTNIRQLFDIYKQRYNQNKNLLDQL